MTRARKVRPSRSLSGERNDDPSASVTRDVRVLVVGGMQRLEPYYRDAPAGIVVDVASADSPSLEVQAEAADALVLVVGAVSHSAAAKVRLVSRRRGTPLAAATGPSVSRVRASIAAAFAIARSGAASI